MVRMRKRTAQDPRIWAREGGRHRMKIVDTMKLQLDREEESRRQELMLGMRRFLQW
jgi:hypothetical protein